MCKLIQANTIKDVLKGWDIKKQVLWKNYNDDKLKETAEFILNEGIKKLFKEIKLCNEVNLPKCFLINSDSMVMLNYLINDDNNNIKKENIFEKCENSNNAIGIIEEKFYKKINIYNKPLSSYSTSTTSQMQGLAFMNNVFINRLYAHPDLGLHVLTHEIVHTLANPDVVCSLREKDMNGDEGINEFFARLVSFFLKDKNIEYCFATNNEIFTKGIYNDKIDADKRLCTIKSINNETNLMEEIIKLGKFYFMGSVS